MTPCWRRRRQAPPDLANPTQPDWPEADFIVGNPPFIGGKDIRAELGGDYAEPVARQSQRTRFGRLRHAMVGPAHVS
jgi:hypothetical protein